MYNPATGEVSQERIIDYWVTEGRVEPILAPNLRTAREQVQRRVITSRMEQERAYHPRQRAQ